MLGGLRFDNLSFAPHVQATLSSDTGTFNWTSYLGYVPNLSNPSLQFLNPTAAPSGWEGVATWADNKLCSAISNGGGNFVRYREVFLPRIPGDWSASITNVNGAFHDFTPPGFSGPVTNVFPFIDENGFHWRGAFCLAGGGTGGEPWVAFGNGDQGGVGLRFFQGLTTGFSFPQMLSGQSYAFCYDPSLLTNDNINRWLVGAQATTNPHPIILLRYRMSQITPQTAQVLTLQLSDPALDPYFQSVSGVSISATYNGFIIVLNTAGAGPTGQPVEVMYCDKDMKTYALLKFVGIGPIPATQVGRNVNTWQVKTDVDGTLWFNSGQAADTLHVLYNFAILGSPWPSALFDYQPLKLPCIDPCMDYM